MLCCTTNLFLLSLNMLYLTPTMWRYLSLNCSDGEPDRSNQDTNTHFLMQNHESIMRPCLVRQILISWVLIQFLSSVQCDLKPVESLFKKTIVRTNQRLAACQNQINGVKGKWSNLRSNKKCFSQIEWISILKGFWKRKEIESV